MDELINDYNFYPLMDSYGGDLIHLGNRDIFELKKVADSNNNCVAFNSNGFLKSTIDPPEKLMIVPKTSKDYGGLYVKKPDTITVILNVYKRPQYIREQFEAVLNQTVKPTDIYIWNNGCPGDFLFYKKHPNVKFFDNNHNFGVWSRFLAALNSDSKYVCVFDDDTIPGKRWLENCVKTIQTHNGLLGTIGVVFKKGSTYSVLSRFGWDNPNEETKQVDIVGHSWFFKRCWLESFIKELPDREVYKRGGEDIHFSYVLQKYNNLNTYVPPHPKNDVEMWGSKPDTAYKYGTDSAAISMDMGGNSFNNALQMYIKKKFLTIENTKSVIRNYTNSVHFFLDKIRNNKPFALIRLGDGEYSVLVNRGVVAQEGWVFSGKSVLTDHLQETINTYRPNFYFGISAPCDNRTMYQKYTDIIPNKTNLTFANIFCNKNYQAVKRFFEETDMNAVLISCKKPKDGLIGKIKIIHYYEISEKLVETWDTEHLTHKIAVKKLANQFQNTLFLISGGPVGKVLIYYMYNENSKNFYLDVGSTIDPYIKCGTTREYHNPNSGLAQHVCHF